MSLPEPRESGMPYRICLVCLGNICRSPMAEQVVRAELERAGLERQVRVDSAGTGSWHVGGPMDERAAATLRIHGYATDHVARRFDSAWFAERDLVLAMDADNQQDLVAMAPDTATAQQRIKLYLTYAPALGPRAEVPDPYYGGEDGFTTVLNMIESAGKGLVRELAELLRGDRRSLR